MSDPDPHREFRAVGDARAAQNNVNPYYVEDLKKLVSVARLDGKLYGFDDLCKYEGCPLSAGLLQAKSEEQGDFELSIPGGGARDVIHELNEVHEAEPLAGAGFEVHARHTGWMQRTADLERHADTAGQLIISAHAYGSAKLLHRLGHEGTLSKLSDQLGHRQE